MPAKPTEYPRWDGTGGKTDPDEPLKTVGYADADVPDAEHINWLFNLFYTWLHFLGETYTQLTDLFSPIVISRTSPTTGGGTLIRTSGAGVVYFDGRRVNGESATKTYSASKDTYVDLSRDGSWAYAEVNNLDPEPAVPANHFRFRKVVTDATELTSVVEMNTASAAIVTTRDMTVDDLTCSDVFASSNVVAGGFVQGDVFSYNAAEVRKVWVPATAWCILPGSIANADLDWGGSPGSSPTTMDGLNKGAGSAGALFAFVPFPASIPTGALITGITIRAAANPGAGTVTASAFRREILTDATDQFCTTGAEALTGASQANHALTLDASSAIRTLDKETYAYGLWIQAGTAAAPAFRGAQITYEVTSVYD